MTDLFPSAQITTILSHLEGVVRSIDPQISSSKLTELTSSWNQIISHARSELAVSLSNTSDTVVIQHRTIHAKNVLIDNCLQVIINMYPHRDISGIINTLKELRSLPFGPQGDPPMEVISSSEVPKKPWYHPWAKNWKNYLPIFSWLPTYSIRRDLLGDLQAGITVSFIAIPQSLAYATLAGLPPVYGLYASLIAPLIYMIFGSSNEISVGPVSMVSLTLSSSLSGFNQEEYISLSITLSIICGILLFVLGICRLGFLIENLISTPTMMGFTQGAATLIILSQMKGLLNIPLSGNAKTVIDYSTQLTKYSDQFSWRTTVMGVGAIILIIGSRLISRRIPMTFIILVLGTLLGYLLKLAEYGIPITGPIPRGISLINSVKIPKERGSFFVSALLIVILGYMESISIGRRLAQLRRYRLDCNSELVALGLANLAGSIFRAYPVTGSVSRSSENYWNNAKTRAHNLIIFIVILITLLIAAPLFKWTPKCILAAVVIAAALALIDWKLTEVRFLWKLREYFDLGQIGIVWGGVLLFGPEIGVIIAVLVTLVQVIFRAARPSIIQLGRVPDTFEYRSIERYPGLITTPGIVVIRVDSRLAFYNISWFQDRLSKLDTANLKAVIIDASGINTLDSTAVHAIEIVISTYQDQKILFLWVKVKGPVRDTMNRSGIMEKISADHFFLSIQDAVDYATTQI